MTTYGLKNQPNYIFLYHQQQLTHPNLAPANKADLWLILGPAFLARGQPPMPKGNLVQCQALRWGETGLHGFLFPKPFRLALQGAAGVSTFSTSRPLGTYTKGASAHHCCQMGQEWHGEGNVAAYYVAQKASSCEVLYWFPWTRLLYSSKQLEILPPWSLTACPSAQNNKVHSICCTHVLVHPSLITLPILVLA